MKRNITISLLVSLLLLVLHGCAVGQAKEEPNKQQQDTVYVTRNGKKYHLLECRYASSSSAITLTSAIASGYMACSVCKPPKSTSTNRTPQSLFNNGQEKPITAPQHQSTTARQCMAYTKSGLRCKRTTTSASGKCWQHE